MLISSTFELSIPWLGQMARTRVRRRQIKIGSKEANNIFDPLRTRQNGTLAAAFYSLALAMARCDWQ
jgi:hypothetical protein